MSEYASEWVGGWVGGWVSRCASGRVNASVQHFDGKMGRVY